MQNEKAKHHAQPPRQSRFCYFLARIVTGFVARFIFKRRFIRNELRGKRGPIVVIANHQAAYDFVNLFGATSRRMHFVISESFYNTLPIKKFLSRLGVIAKQQFQTTIKDIHLMKSVTAAGGILVIYPAGLMCEDGLSTPIPAATYQFLQWLGVPVYMARTSGTYFAMPKWADGLRSGRTYMDIFRLFSAEELREATLDEIKERTDAAMLFDAYREQEELLVEYKNGGNIEGLENVLYVCPHCRSEHTVRVRDGNIIYCEHCGYAEESDKYGFLHKISECGEEIRYVSDWSRMIYDMVRKEAVEGRLDELYTDAEIQMIDGRCCKFVPVGHARVGVDREHFHIDGVLRGEDFSLSVSTANFASLPFSPGRYFEIQHGADIFRCLPTSSDTVMKLANLVKVFYELRAEAPVGE